MKVVLGDHGINHPYDSAGRGDGIVHRGQRVVLEVGSLGDLTVDGHCLLVRGTSTRIALSPAQERQIIRELHLDAGG